MRGWIIGLALCAAAQAASAAELRLAYADQEVPPYYAGNGPEIPPKPGVVIEMVQRLLADSPHTLILTRLPARRLHEEIRAGRQDGLIGTRYTPDRAAIMAYPTRAGGPDARRLLASVRYVLYARRETPVRWDDAGLRDFYGALGIPSGVTALHRLKGMDRVATVEAPNSHQLFSMLARGRITAVVMLGASGDRYVGEFEGAEIVRLDPPLLTEDFYIPFTRSFYEANRDFVEAFWQRLEQQRDSLFAELLPGYRLSP